MPNSSAPERVRAANQAAQGPSYVVVEGPIGVGKTSLARRLAQSLGAELELERPDENPFLERYYLSRRQYALPVQLFFLFQRARQLARLAQGDMFSPTRVTDFMLDKDPLFARVTLDPDELRLYEQVYAQLSLEVPRPDLVVYLQAPVDVILDRVRKRGIEYERGIDREYLQKVAEAYTQYFHGYNAGPLLVVNAAEIDFVSSDADFQMLLEHIRGIRSGRHFFNPLAGGT